MIIVTVPQSYIGFPGGANGKEPACLCRRCPRQRFICQLQIGTCLSTINWHLPRIHRRTIQERSSWPDNHNGVITNLEPDILECEVKWASGSITMSKASGDDRIPVELFQILKDDAVKVLHSMCLQIWKTQQQPQDWKRSVFIPMPNKGSAK